MSEILHRVRPMQRLKLYKLTLLPAFSTLLVFVLPFLGGVFYLAVLVGAASSCLSSFGSLCTCIRRQRFACISLKCEKKD